MTEGSFVLHTRDAGGDLELTCPASVDPRPRGHRELAKTKSNAVENQVVTALFRPTHDGECDVTSHDMLLAAAEQGGLDRTEARKWLDEGKGGAEVDKEVQQAYALGVQGVPHFTINGQDVLEGAQSPEEFLKHSMRTGA